MEKGILQVKDNNTFLSVHLETESAQITDFATAVKATKVNNAAAADSATHAASADTATKATQDASGNVISDNYIAMPNPLHNAGTHNALFRGRDITDYWTSGGLYAAIAAGTFAGIYPGDYIRVPITVNGATTTYDIVMGDCNYHLHRGSVETTANHVLAFTRLHIGNEHMNATGTTAGGYVGSDMWKTVLPKYTTAIKNAFGADHILTHKELLSNAESDTVPSGAGAGWSGGTTGWDWYDVDVNLFNEPMVYGGKACSSSFFDVGDCNTQVAAMRHDKSLSFTRTYWCWLRAVVSSSHFAHAYSDGSAGCGDASYGDGGVRVYFLLH
jgi:hypothetical protein